MKVQLLSFPGCPNTAAALESLREVLASRRPGVHVEEIDTTATDAPAGLRGWGSPTILIDGQDVGGAVAPGHTSCRLYRDANGRMQGVPPRALIEAAVARAGQGRGGWLRSLAAVPGAALPLLPSVTCPACAVAYAGVLSSLGLGFLLSDRVLVPIIVASLVVGVASVAWSTRSHRRPGPLVATLVGVLGVVIGRLVWRVPAVLYVGVALLLGASIWNLWLKRPRPMRPIPLDRL